MSGSCVDCEVLTLEYFGTLVTKECTFQFSYTKVPTNECYQACCVRPEKWAGLIIGYDLNYGPYINMRDCNNMDETEKQLASKKGFEWAEELFLPLAQGIQNYINTSYEGAVQRFGYHVSAQGEMAFEIDEDSILECESGAYHGKIHSPDVPEMEFLYTNGKVLMVCFTEVERGHDIRECESDTDVGEYLAEKIVEFMTEEYEEDNAGADELGEECELCEEECAKRNSKSEEAPSDDKG